MTDGDAMDVSAGEMEVGVVWWDIPADAQAGAYSVYVELFDSPPSSPSAIVLDSEGVAFAFMVDDGTSYVQIEKPIIPGSTGKAVVAHVHVSTADLERYELTTRADFCQFMESVELESNVIKEHVN